jgi:hypothetical protein
MKLFITWSGDTSKAIATALRNWIPPLVQSVEPFMSETDIEKGSQWDQIISLQLDESYAGIVCLTPDNLTSPWLLFEAGALSKSENSASRVFTYLHGLKPSQVESPLSRFQHTLATKEDTKRLLFDIRKLAPSNPTLTDEMLGKMFEMAYPELEQQINRAPSSLRPAQRHTREMTEEILEIVREIQRRIQESGPNLPSTHFVPRLLSPEARNILGGGTNAEVAYLIPTNFNMALDALDASGTRPSDKAVLAETGKRSARRRR